MAQFNAGGRLKSIFSGNSLSIGFDAFHHHSKVKMFSGGGGGSFTYSLSRDRKRKLSAYGVNASKSSSSSPSATNNSGGIFDEVLEDDAEVEIDELAGFRGLVLDISYRPVNVVCWKRAICLEFMDKDVEEHIWEHILKEKIKAKIKRILPSYRILILINYTPDADVLEYYDQTINSPSGSFYIPAVLRVPHLLQVVKRRKVKRGLSRKNIFHRDNYTCQYCSSSENLTIDHVLPIARGGKWTWENLVAACAKCNSRKGQKTLEEANMKLLKVPKAPKDYDILAIPLTNYAIKMMRMRKGMPEEWRQYLSMP